MVKLITELKLFIAYMMDFVLWQLCMHRSICPKLRLVGDWYHLPGLFVAQYLSWLEAVFRSGNLLNENIFPLNVCFGQHYGMIFSGYNIYSTSISHYKINYCMKYTPSPTAPSSSHNISPLTSFPHSAIVSKKQSSMHSGDLGGKHFQFIRHYYSAAIQIAILQTGSLLLWVDSRWLN